MTNLELVGVALPASSIPTLDHSKTPLGYLDLTQQTANPLLWFMLK